jgi:hypothetical protein
MLLAARSSFETMVWEKSYDVDEMIAEECKIAGEQVVRAE